MLALYGHALRERRVTYNNSMVNVIMDDIDRSFTRDDTERALPIVQAMERYDGSPFHDTPLSIPDNWKDELTTSDILAYNTFTELLLEPVLKIARMTEEGHHKEYNILYEINMMMAGGDAAQVWLPKVTYLKPPSPGESSEEHTVPPNFDIQPILQQMSESMYMPSKPSNTNTNPPDTQRHDRLQRRTYSLTLPFNISGLNANKNHNLKRFKNRFQVISKSKSTLATNRNPTKKISKKIAIQSLKKNSKVNKSDPIMKSKFELELDDNENWQGKDPNDETSGGREFLRKRREKKLLQQWDRPENGKKDLERSEDRNRILEHILDRRRSRHHRSKHSKKHKKHKNHKRKGILHEVKSKFHKYDKYMKKLDEKYFNKKDHSKKHKKHHKKKKKHKRHGKKHHKGIRKTFEGLKLNSKELHSVPDYKIEDKSGMDIDL
ncbi:hypothetical protein O0L34_g16028 [Tuta absoluta]|nr:hypothetical protein O0L34_g16028 [Tuta absoluta]